MIMTNSRFDEIEEGDELEPYSVKAGYMELNRFAAANNEFVLIHMDPDYSKDTAKLPDVIVMGNLKLAYITNMIDAWKGDDGWVSRLEVSFRGMDAVNETLTARGVVKEKREEGGQRFVDLDVWVENSEGKKTTPGSATVSLP